MQLDLHSANSTLYTYLHTIIQRRADSYQALGNFSAAQSALSHLLTLRPRSLDLRPQVWYLARKAQLQKCVDHYEVLGVKKGADGKVVKGAYRRLVLKVHPDKAEGEGRKKACEEVFKMVTEVRWSIDICWLISKRGLA